MSIYIYHYKKCMTFYENYSPREFVKLIEHTLLFAYSFASLPHHNEMSGPCPVCKALIWDLDCAEGYVDGYFCVKCDVWTEDPCSSPNCDECEIKKFKPSQFTGLVTKAIGKKEWKRMERLAESKRMRAMRSTK